MRCQSELGRFMPCDLLPSELSHTGLMAGSTYSSYSSGSVKLEKGEIFDNGAQRVFVNKSLQPRVISAKFLHPQQVIYAILSKCQ